jgi:hypothetical protein
MIHTITAYTAYANDLKQLVLCHNVPAMVSARTELAAVRKLEKQVKRQFPRFQATLHMIVTIKREG